ncbi:MAG: hypothetical protein NVSMB5_13950 [Candidatus Velthaea sp.]
MERMKPVVACVGTTHPLHVAGLGLPVRVADRIGVRVVSVVAGVSAQDARGVHARTPLDAASIAAQFVALTSANVRAIHVGALLDAASVGAVALALARFPGVPIVCDPVIAASTGERLADDATIDALRELLFARCTLLTPNLHEAALLLGAKPADAANQERTARALLAAGSHAVLLTGGHLAGVPADVLVRASGSTFFAAPRIAATLRGTGDLLAFAIAARLARGDALHPAIDAARIFVRGEIAQGVDFAGMRTAR